MLYKVIYKQGTSAEISVQLVTCDSVQMPQLSGSLIQFKRNPNTLVFAINPNDLVSMELLGQDDDT